MKKRLLHSKFLVTAWLVFISWSAFSQTVNAVPDRYKIFIGEQIKVKLSAENISTGVSWFYLPDSVNHIEIVDKGKIDTVAKGGLMNLYQTITITSFDSGIWKFPAMLMGNKATAPFNIQVIPVDVSKLKDYNEIKDIIEVKAAGNWWITIIIAIATLIALVVLIWLLKKKKKFIQEVEINNHLSPIQWAMEELAKLEKEKIRSPADVKKYYSELISISRTFFDKQTRQKASYKTTDEWMINLQSMPVDNDNKLSFFQLLRLADTVKFAKYIPVESEYPNSLTCVRNMLQQVSLLHTDNHTKYQPAL